MSETGDTARTIRQQEALILAETHALQQVAEAIRHMSEQTVGHMAASTRALEKLTDRVEGMNTRLIRLEEAKHGREIDKLTEAMRLLSDRANALEADLDQRKGAMSLVGWVQKLWPAMALGGIGTLFGLKLGSG